MSGALKVDEFITHRKTLSEMNSAFETMNLLRFLYDPKRLFSMRTLAPWLKACVMSCIGAFGTQGLWLKRSGRPWYKYGVGSGWIEP
jgi:hypothetical protein